MACPASRPQTRAPFLIGYVTLDNRGNPDFGQDPSRPMPGTSFVGERRVFTLEEASAVCRAYIEANHLGGGNWTGGVIRDERGVIVARVSYNGRIWSPDDSVCLYSPGN